jgi:hypothetical protein
MGALRRYSGLAACVLIAALLGNVLAAAFCHPPAKQAPSDYPVELLGAFVICSGEHDTQGDKRSDLPNPPCQICAAVSAVNLIVAFIVLALLFPAAAGRLPAPRYAATFADRLRRSGLHSRAPPLPA